MMPLAALVLEELDSLGVRLRADGAELRCSAPKGALGPSIVERIREHKAELLEAARGREYDRQAVLPWRAVIFDDPMLPCVLVLRMAGQIQRRSGAHIGALAASQTETLRALLERIGAELVALEGAP